jgi:ankyrin repeat protein
MTRRDYLLLAAAATACAGPAAGQSGDIFALVRAGDEAGVLRLLAADPALIRTRDARGATPLMVAAFKRQGVGFARPEDNPMFALLAPKVTRPDLVEACLLHRRDLVAAAVKADRTAARTASAEGRTLLHYAAYVGDVALLDLLLDAGADIDAAAKGAFLTRPIVQAILGGRQATLERLIARGADVSAVLDNGSRPMHEAALLGRNEMVRALRKAGADLKATRHDGKTPRDLAAGAGHLATVALFDQLAG